MTLNLRYDTEALMGIVFYVVSDIEKFEYGYIKPGRERMGFGW